MDTLSHKIVSIHQPNYLPWSGFFYKLYCSDAFVFLDHVKLNKKSFTRRTFIADSEHSEGKVLLTIPLCKHADDTIINELIIDHSKDWAAKHLDRIYRYYLHFPFFKSSFFVLETILQNAKQYHKLSDINIFVIKTLASHLDLERKYYLSSEMDLHSKKNEMNAEIVQLVGGQVYFCGEGAKDTYFDNQAFDRLKIKFQYSEFLNYINDCPYRLDAVACKTSILDLLFWAGKEGVINYFNQIKTQKNARS